MSARGKAPAQTPIHHWALLLFCVAFLFSCIQTAFGAASGKSPPGEAFFTENLVRTFKIDVAEPGLSVLTRNDRNYVRATVTEGTNVFKDVGIHLKGMGSFRPFAEKPSIAVKFDKYVDDQTYQGLTKIMLNNSSQDPTYVAELMATEMFRAAGVPAARVTHAFVEVNGRALGLYVVIEAMNKEFLKQYFRNAKGNLYEAYLQDIDQKLDLDGGSDSSQADLKKLVDATKVTDPAQRWAALNEVLDVEGYISHLVVEMFTSHTDGYAMNRNNYRLYHDPATERFVFLAHGIDWAFSNTGVSTTPPNNTLVTRAVLQTPEGRRRYREQRANLFTNLFNVDVMTNRVNNVVAKLKSAARSPQETRDFENYGVEMRNRIVNRAAFIATELSRPAAKPLAFGSDDAVLVTDWRVEKGKTEGAFDQVEFEGKPSLHLRVDKGDGIVSWRKKVLLDEGAYRLEAIARTANVSPLTNVVERGNGAGLRVSGDKRTNHLSGTVAWTPLHHDFQVMEGGDEKELICELRASQGEAWFGTGSLKLRRLKVPLSPEKPK